MIEVAYSQIVDPQTPYWLMEQQGIAKQQIILQLSDGAVKMYAPDAIINMLLWQIFVKFNIPIKIEHIQPRMPLNSNNLAKMLTTIHNEVAFIYPEKEFERKDAVFTTISNLYNFIVEELNAYVSSISALDLCKIITDPKVVALKKSMNLNTELGTDVIEQKINIASVELLRLLGTEGELSNQTLLIYQQTGTLNKFQVPQMLLAYGPRTDVDDVIIRYPVLDCAVEGLGDIKAFAIESLSAKKSAFYNRVAVTESQYTGRKQHILASSITTIYPGDCGTSLTVKFLIHEKNYKAVVGKNFIKDGVMYTFREENEVKPYIGQYVELRSPLVCRYQDGYCSVCGGLITRNINKKINAGILASIAVFEPTTQRILSAKHLVKTSSQVYDVPVEAAEYFTRLSADMICWTTALHTKLKDLSMGVSNKDLPAGSLTDIQHITMNKNLDEAKYSNITNIILRVNATGEVFTIPLMNNNQCPFFTKEMLMYLRDRYKDIVADGNMYWLPLDGTHQFPIFKSTVINDNMMLFVKSVKDCLESNIDSYTSVSCALRDFSDIVYSKVDNAALMHLEVLLKAYLISSPLDYRIPVVTDPENVRFQTLKNVIANRSIGQKFAHECLGIYLGNPTVYLVPKQGSVFDIYVGIIGPKQAA